tara:strand:+ start:604 stop:882 length:279 start_codon:yes stop_codon:yes gene_type:complete
MESTSLNISLTAAQRAFVDDQVASGGYRTAAEYIRTLLREAQTRQAAEERLDLELLDAMRQIEQGRYETITPEWIAEKKAALKRRFGSNGTA